ncbi:MAG TPA: DUF2914 domain-containing protein [Polyangiaceae bacterium]|jgi:hypothetical protein|nr:DUF2914 domain-containing protein [Polyangiaceae bacterium]
MKMSMVHWLSGLALCATSLTGCGERTEARPPAPVASPVTTLKQEPVAAAPSCPTATPIAATVAEKPANGEPSKAERKPAKLQVKRLVLAQGVKNREPVEASRSFYGHEAERIYAFVEVENKSDHEGEISVAFIPPGGGAAVGNVTLEVGSSPRWRTWAYTRGAQKAGEWTAVVRSETGEVLAREAFEVTL